LGEPVEEVLDAAGAQEMMMPVPIVFSPEAGEKLEPIPEFG
jgi:hypothetical protein